MQIVLCGHDAAANERLGAIVGELGCAFFVADEEEALAKALKTRRPQVLLAGSESDVDKICRLARQNPYPPAVVYIAKQSLCAFEAFQMGISDCLPAPVGKAQLAAALAKTQALSAAQVWALSQNPQKRQSRRQYIAARTHRGVEMIDVDRVYYFAADHKYIKVRHTQGEVLIDETLKNLAQEFGDIMFRVHRSALVNLAYLDLLESVKGCYRVRLRGIGDILSVSRRYLPALREKIQNL